MIKTYAKLHDEYMQLTTISGEQTDLIEPTKQRMAEIKVEVARRVAAEQPQTTCETCGKVMNAVGPTAGQYRICERCASALRDPLASSDALFACTPEIE